MGTSPNYINAASNASINNAATAGWVQINRGTAAVGFQFVLVATGAPIGTLFFEICDDDDPRVATPQSILGATALTLPASMAAGQPTDGLARNFLFDFNPAPSAKWMRARFASSSGGSATVGTFLMGLHQRGL